MKSLKLFEGQETEAHKEAVAKGLKYKGFGYWADGSGKVVARSLGGKLQPVEKAEVDDSEGGAEVAQMAKGKSYDDIAAGGEPTQPVEMGEVLPGEEKAPKEDGQWEPGPDGDTQVGEEPSEVEDDVFVDKDQDSDKWVAGADGSNYKNFKSFDNMVSEGAIADKLRAGQANLKRAMDGSFEPAGAAAEAKKRGLNSDGHGYWLDNAGNPVAKTENGKLVDLTPQEIKRHDLGSRIPGRTTMRDMVKGNRPVDGVMQKRIGAAKDALANISPSERDKYIDAKMATKDGTYKAGKDKGPYHKAMDAQKAIDRMGQKDYDRMKEVEELNAESKQYFLDPEYDLSDANLGDELGTGAFGSVYMSDDGENVIKEGQIGREEMQALDLLKDFEGFPKLVNAEFSSPFRSVSQWEAADSGEVPDTDASGEDFGGTFWTEAQAAMGRYAMSRAFGLPVSDVNYDWDEDSQEAATTNFWQLMATMHKAGVSHNDLHGGNVFFDSMLRPTILDLGLARVNKLTALMEAIASQRDNNYQLHHALQMHNLPQEQIDILETNRANFIDKISDDYSDDEWADEDREFLMSMLEGDIRITEDQLEEYYDRLQFDDDQLQEYIDILYDGFGQEPEDNRSDLEKRMEGGYKAMLDKIGRAAGYNSGEAAADMFRAADDMAVERGEGRIPFKGLDITRNPRKNK